MPKKKSRSSRQSRGTVGSPARARTSVGVQRLLNQLEAWKKGKNVTLTISTKDPKAAKQRISADAVWGTSPAFRNRKNANTSEKQ